MEAVLRGGEQRAGWKGRHRACTGQDAVLAEQSEFGKSRKQKPILNFVCFIAGTEDAFGLKEASAHSM